MKDWNIRESPDVYVAFVQAAPKERGRYQRKDISMNIFVWLVIDRSRTVVETSRAPLAPRRSNKSVPFTRKHSSG